MADKTKQGGGSPTQLADVTGSPTVVRTPSADLISDPTGTPVHNDISCAVRYWDHSADVEELDSRTFCNPGGTEVGATTHSLVIGILWSQEVDDILRPLLGQEVWFEFKDNVDDTTVTRFESRYNAVPLGRHEVGQLVEVELACAVLAEPITGSTPTP